MAQSKVFSIIGDSNVRKNISKTNSRACPLMTGCQVLSCGKLQLLDESLNQIRKESNVCILSCITNFLVSSEEDSRVSRRIEPVLDEFCTSLSAACAARPDVSFVVAPPMYRQSPLWYREGLPEVLSKFSTYLRDRPASAYLLPSFATPEFDQDGIHLTAYSGLEFMIHLFDASIAVLDSVDSTCEDRIPITSESTRLLEDRVMVLEQDHQRLSKVVETKTASDAELHDYHENIKNEPFFTITGCDRIIANSTKDWQDRARKMVAPILKELMGRDVPIAFISNATGPGRDAQVRYNVRLLSTEVSKEVWTKFSSFYLNGRDERPAFFKPYSIRNLLTQESRIRLAILQVIGRRYKDANPGSQVKAIGYDPRPVLRILPAQDADSRRVKTFTFIEAVAKFPTNFSKSDLDFILSKVGFKQKGQLRSLFICISDDMLSKRSRARNQPQGEAMDQGQAPDTAPAATETINETARVSHTSRHPVSTPSLGEGTSGSSNGSRASDSRSSSRSSASGRAGSKRGPSPISPGHTAPEKTSRA